MSESLRAKSHRVLRAYCKWNEQSAKGCLFSPRAARTRYEAHTPHPQPHTRWAGRRILADYKL